MSQLQTQVTSPPTDEPAGDASSTPESGVPGGSDPLITEGPHTNRPEWSTRRAVVTGVVVGALFGIVFFAGYAGASAWICSSRLDCGHWAPIAIVASIGAFSFTLLGAAVAFFLHKIYRMFKVA